MPPTNEPPPPLPLAPNRAALSNRISLLLSSQSTILKSMNLAPRPPTSRPPRAHPDDDSDFLNGTRPNEGVGYVPDAKAAPVGNAREDRALRGGLGKGTGKGKNGRAKEKWKVESESEDEVGRSALGKRKRPRREVVVEVDEDQKDGEGDGEGGEGKEDVKMEDTPEDGVEDKAEAVDGAENGERKKRKKKKKKTKNKTKSQET